MAPFSDAAPQFKSHSKKRPFPREGCQHQELGLQSISRDTGERTKRGGFKPVVIPAPARHTPALWSQVDGVLVR